eukprot:1891130-Pyramimonas_sp.AAC.1
MSAAPPNEAASARAERRGANPAAQGPGRAPQNASALQGDPPPPRATRLGGQGGIEQVGNSSAPVARARAFPLARQD